jgi:hypothetical protein
VFVPAEALAGTEAVLDVLQVAQRAQDQLHRTSEECRAVLKRQSCGLFRRQ